ncbi:MAG: hypothetical protein ACLP51_02605 [Syntrophobacteraceae bacterium]
MKREYLADRVGPARTADRVQTVPAKAGKAELVNTVTLSRSSCHVVPDVTPFPQLPTAKWALRAPISPPKLTF